MYEEMGNVFNVYMLWNSNIFTVEPEHIKAVLATDFANFEKGPVFEATMRSVLGTGVFNSDGERWKFHRAMTRPFFVRDKIAHFEIYDAHARAAIGKMRARTREGGALDVQDVVGRFTLDAASDFLFGQCVRSLDGALPRAHEAPDARVPSAGEAFARAFSAAQDVISYRNMVGPVWRLLEVRGDRTAEAMRVVSAFIDPIVREAIRKRQQQQPHAEQKDEVADEDTLLDYLVRQTSGAPSLFVALTHRGRRHTDMTILKDETLNIMIAGRDTTASAITCALYALATHPRVLARLRAEVLARVGPARAPTYADVRDMRFLRAVINEVLRLWPPVPFDVRTSVGEALLPAPKADEDGRPYYLPPGTA
jgi:cytochrome P450